MLEKARTRFVDLQVLPDRRMAAADFMRHLQKSPIRQNLVRGEHIGNDLLDGAVQVGQLLCPKLHPRIELEETIDLCSRVWSLAVV